MKSYFHGQSIKSFLKNNHHLKYGTPTFGGVVILTVTIFSLVLSYFIKHGFNKHTFDSFALFTLDNRVLSMCFLMLYYFMIGLIDDFMKVTNKQNGIKSLTKLMHQLLAASIAISILDPDSNLFIPFYGYIEMNLYFHRFLCVLLISLASNAFNITDGLDGLATLTLLPVLCFCLFICNFTYILICALIGGMLAFLLFNKFPAKIFMGDCAALPIGGLIGIISIIEKCEILIIFASGIFMIELASSFIQIFSIRIFKRKIFKMAPLHHHFEYLDWPEKKIVKIFFFLSLFFSILSFILSQYLL